jgi:hypothetical protein
MKMKKQVVRPMSESLQVRECVEEVRTPRRSPVATTELIEFQSSLLLKPKAREAWQPKDCLSDNEGVYSWGGTSMWGMRVCEKWA